VRSSTIYREKVTGENRSKIAGDIDVDGRSGDEARVLRPRGMGGWSQGILFGNSEPGGMEGPDP
jgi:hypothetical protein